MDALPDLSAIPAHMAVPESRRRSGWRLPKESMPAEVAYQAVRDELRPDVEPQLNLATFITTGWSRKPNG